MCVINLELNTEHNICLCDVIMKETKSISRQLFQIEKRQIPLYRVLEYRTMVLLLMSREINSNWKTIRRALPGIFQGAR